MRNLQALEIAKLAQRYLNEAEVDNKHLHAGDKQISKRKNTSKRKKDLVCEGASPTSDISDDPLEWYPVRHPKLPIATTPRYSVSKKAVVCSNVKTKRIPLKLNKGTATPSYYLKVDKKIYAYFKLEEIMAYTFWGHSFDRSIHWVYYKDRNRNNCAWDNLYVCDLPTLQKLELERLERLQPGTKYTVVRNVHDTKTFERYLVSDAGDLYSIISRRPLYNKVDEDTYQRVRLSSDTDAVQGVNKANNLTVHSIVLQSFKGRRPEGFHIDHCNGDKWDNSLKNLAFVTPSENMRRAYQQEQKEAREQRRKQERIPKKNIVRPLPINTKETKWKTIGILPWKGWSFNRYEVSDTGYVRKVNGGELIKMSCATTGYLVVSLRCDIQEVNDTTSTATREPYITLLVSRLVADAFVAGYSKTRNVARHINGNRQDNRAENLQWISRTCSSVSQKTRRVVATLVDDPDAQKEFPSMIRAQIELRSGIRGTKYGDIIQRAVEWNGFRRMANIQVF